MTIFRQCYQVAAGWAVAVSLIGMAGCTSKSASVDATTAAEDSPSQGLSSSAVSPDSVEPLAITPALAVSGTLAAANGGAEKTKVISFDDVKFKMEKTEPFKRSMLTEKIEDLAGKRIRIKGYMLPSFQQRGIKKFVLVRDNMECCFGPGAALFDCIIVEMKQGKSATFSVRPISVEGVFKIKAFKDPDGKHLAIYHLDGEKIGS